MGSDLDLGVGFRLRRLGGWLLVAFAFVTMPLMVAYGDWLRFSSPHAPNSQTGQTIYYKGVRGVFYITSRQDALIGGRTFLVVWCIGLIGFALLHSSQQRQSSAEKTVPIWMTVLAWLFAAYWFALLVFPDHAMALFLTGLLTPPPDLHQFEPTVVPGS